MIGFAYSHAVRKAAIKCLRFLLECCNDSEQMKVCLAYFYPRFIEEIESRLEKLDCKIYANLYLI